jgi:hypothetical protein
MRSPCCLSLCLYFLSFCWEAYEITLLSLYLCILQIFRFLRGPFRIKVK